MPRYSTSSRHSRNRYASSSAFSSSAHADENWTLITDLSERRRIQNRIAQRNYRKKLKRRLEDLEKQTGSSSASAAQPNIDFRDHPSLQGTSPRQCVQSPGVLRHIPIIYDTFKSSSRENSHILPDNIWHDDSRVLTKLEYYPEQYSAPENIYPSCCPIELPQHNFCVFPNGESLYEELLKPVPAAQQSCMGKFDDDECMKQEHDSSSPYGIDFQGLNQIQDIHSFHNYSDLNLCIASPVSRSYEQFSFLDSGY